MECRGESNAHHSRKADLRREPWEAVKLGEHQQTLARLSEEASSLWH